MAWRADAMERPAGRAAQPLPEVCSVNRAVMLLLASVVVAAGALVRPFMPPGAAPAAMAEDRVYGPLGSLDIDSAGVRARVTQACLERSQRAGAPIRP